ncbi:hypothetical protein DFJ43DRAFT_1101981 [Lentinula guzmanii]|uniref:Uncharacterized protein n=1 Tax=Lentinula guzmanii TaxID=2804957 RepID=A0AA38JAC6_9AGAR|nr:hypothetical protein DFJ43DRAFT_1101981 [Lentinula guzmanii]
MVRSRTVLITSFAVGIASVFGAPVHDDNLSFRIPGAVDPNSSMNFGKFGRPVLSEGVQVKGAQHSPASYEGGRGETVLHPRGLSAADKVKFIENKKASLSVADYWLFRRIELSTKMGPLHPDQIKQLDEVYQKVGGQQGSSGGEGSVGTDSGLQSITDESIRKKIEYVQRNWEKLTDQQKTRFNTNLDFLKNNPENTSVLSTFDIYVNLVQKKPRAVKERSVLTFNPIQRRDGHPLTRQTAEVGLPLNDDLHSMEYPRTYEHDLD